MEEGDRGDRLLLTEIIDRHKFFLLEPSRIRIQSVYYVESVRSLLFAIMCRHSTHTHTQHFSSLKIDYDIALVM